MVLPHWAVLSPEIFQSGLLETNNRGLWALTVSSTGAPITSTAERDMLAVAIHAITVQQCSPCVIYGPEIGACLLKRPCCEPAACVGSFIQNGLEHSILQARVQGGYTRK